jgi:hypothetical protein
MQNIWNYDIMILYPFKELLPSHKLIVNSSKKLFLLYKYETSSYYFKQRKTKVAISINIIFEKNYWVCVVMNEVSLKH